MTLIVPYTRRVSWFGPRVGGGHNGPVSSRQRKRRGNQDRILFSPRAVDVATEAVGEIGGDEVGEHIGVSAPVGQDGSGHVAIHRFRSTAPGYRGWEWVVVLAAVPGSEEITVNEVTLQAGRKATLAPEWVPYEDRVRPGDLGPGDRLPPRPDDERLVPWSELKDGAGFIRNPRGQRTLSETGLSQALTRWRKGKFGPTSEYAQAAAMSCRTCAFYLPIDAVDTHFGACANEFAADGRVVHESYGCGAHSDTKEESLSASQRDYGAFDDGL
ncbi:DUF3027 domain-containing protein [Corynebacterium heidelbergense]|uniref:DUF3027 domain-containing protein n=1 Tax=Corynebacterium heidelbergense TaxID=2055947 RepID=A0A364VC95_9CORY|nr:DUF3027 domain-containing protein [Corynebacterium heidelbergense]